MNVRELRVSDVEILREIAARSGYPYPDGEALELVRVVEDDDHKPVMACAGKKLVELYLWNSLTRPLAVMHGLKLLHDDMAQTLRAKGYRSAECFLPPALAEQFGRRLEKSFGWNKNWPSWSREL